MSESNQDSEFIAQRIADVERAREADDLPRALELLQQLTDLQAPKIADLENLRRRIMSWKASYVNERAEQIQAAFKSDPIDEDVIRETLYELMGVDPENSSLPAWRSRLARQIDSARMAQVSEEVEAEVERMLAEASEAEGGGRFGLQLLSLYRETYEYAARMESNYPSAKLSNLRSKTRTTLNLARNRHEMASTRQQGDQFSQLLAQLRLLEPSEMVTIALDRQQSQQTMMSILVKDAIGKVEQQASEFAREKSVEYRNAARDSLRGHAPHEAHDRLSEALNLIGLDEEHRTIVTRMLTDEVQPALERRRRSEEELAQAKQAGPTVQAWGLLMGAADEDPYTPGLEAERRSLRPDVKRYLVERLAIIDALFTAESPLDAHIVEGLVKLERATDETDMKRQLDSLQKIAGEDADFSEERREAERLMREFASWQTLAREIDKTILAEQEKITTEPQAVYHRMGEWSAGWGARAQRFPNLTAFQSRVGRSADAAAQMARFVGGVTNPELTTARKILEECSAVIEAEDRLSTQRPALEQVQRRLKLHVDYLQGLALLRKTNATPVDRQQGLRLLHTVIDGQGDDQAAAEQMVSSIITDQAEKEKTQQAIALARELLAKNQAEQAYRTLKPVQNYPDAAELFNRIASIWEDAIRVELGKLLNAEELNEQPAKSLIAHLEDVGAEDVHSLKSIVYGRSAAQRARRLMSESSPNWTNVWNVWVEALESDPDNGAYKEGKRNADKRLAFNQVSGSLLDHLDTLNKLIKEYSGDLEIRRWYVDTYLEYIRSLETHEEIEREANKARSVVGEALQLADVLSDKTTETRLRRSEKELNDWIDIAQRSMQIEAQLHPDHMLESWKLAENRAGDLVKEYSKELKVRQWWRKTKANAIEDARNRLTEKQRAGADIWERVHPAAQWLSLEDQAGSAKQTVYEVYTAISTLAESLNGLEKDRIGSDYGGNIVLQIDAVEQIRRKLILAGQVLASFGGEFQKPDELRKQVADNIQKSVALIDRLTRLKTHVEQARHNAISARANEEYWHGFKAQWEQIGTLGYGQHISVVALKSQEDTIVKKQQHLRQLRTQLETAVQQEELDEVLRLAELMTGRSSHESNGTPSSNHQDKVADPMADEGDEFGEQARIRVQEPYSKKTISTLRRVIQSVQGQQTQIAQWEDWLPSIPGKPDRNGNPTDTRYKKRVAQWQNEINGMEQYLNKGDFASARERINVVIKGNNEGMYDGVLALRPATQLLSTPPMEEAALLSTAAERLWKHWVQLRAKCRGDLEAAERYQTEIDRRENQWNDCWARFESAATASMNADGRFVRFAKAREIRQLKDSARAAYNLCLEVCPDHPDLVGWSDSPALGG